MAKHWMSNAFANSHGQFKAKARKAGESTAAFASRHKHDKGKTGQQARLAQTGMKLGKKAQATAIGKHLAQQM